MVHKLKVCCIPQLANLENRSFPYCIPTAQTEQIKLLLNEIIRPKI